MSPKMVRLGLLFVSLPMALVVAARLPAAADQLPSDDDKLGLRQTVLGLDQQFWTAAGRHDTVALDKLFADNYLGVGIDGTRWTKREILDQHARVRIVDMQRSTQPEVIQLNDRAAVLTYDATFRMAANDGQPLDAAHQHLLSCWVQRDGAWVVVFAQVTPAATPPKG